jgi:O-antigen/teichoic acid export membrane protein
MSGLRTIARNSAFHAGSEILTKLASLAFYVVMARELGSAGFGDYMFALSLTVLLTSLAGFGTDGLLSRNVARDREEIHQLFWNSIALKLGLGVLLIAAALLVAVVGGYSDAVVLTVALLGVGTLIELLSKTVGAAFLAHDDLRPVATGLILQRFSTAAVGIAALVAGAGIVPVAAIYLGGAALGLAYVAPALYRREIRPRREVSLRRAREVAARAAPFGLLLIFGTIIFRIDATLLSLYKGAEPTGLYSAAYRALESCLFIPFAIETAMLPMLSRLSRTSVPPVSAYYEAGLKVIVAFMMPFGLAFLLYGGAVLELLYGAEYRSAETAMHWLGGAAVLYGVSLLTCTLVIAQDGARKVAWIVGSVMVFNVLLNLVVIPRWSLNGAAAVTTITEAVQAIVLLYVAWRMVGAVSLRRILTGPLLAGAAMAAVGILVGGDVAWLLPVTGVYLLVILAVERALFPSDLARVEGAVRARLGRA